MELFEEASLETAQAAIERGDYGEAIAHLEKIRSEEIDPDAIARAQQGLVVAYAQSDRLQEAIDLCAWLAEDVAINPWAPRTLADLQERQERERLARGEAEEGLLAPSQSPQASRLPAPIAGPDAGIYEGGRRWRQAERAKRWQPLKPLAAWRFWALQIGSLVALFGLLRWCGILVMQGTNQAFAYLYVHRIIPLSWFQSFSLAPQISWGSAIALVGLLIISPWWLDWLLRAYYGAKVLSPLDLAARAPNTTKFLQRYCRKHQIRRPPLRCLPLEEPIAIAYGGPVPGSTYFAISTGLLDRLQDAEIEALIASLLGQAVRRDCILMSAIVGLLQVPYLAYWELARLGNRCRRSWLKIPCGIAAAACYGLYWLWRLPALWFSRRRLYYGDRFAAEVTGDPNALSRALLKVALGTASATLARQETHAFLESFDLLLPLAPRQSLSTGSIPPYTPFESVLAWECTNPYRHWLKVFDSHALLGDRLFLLGRYAARWQLPAELDLPTVAPSPKTLAARLKKLANSYTALPILQSGVLTGGFLGLALWGLFWIVGTLGLWLDLRALAWLRAAAADSIIAACLLFCFSLCAIVWINDYFPDIPRTTSEGRLPNLLAKQKSTPHYGRAVRLSGTLIGREGTANWLARDAILQTENGAVELNFSSVLGPLGYLLARRRPCDFCGQSVTIYGWFRRGTTAWIDVDRLVPASGRSLRGGYPWWVTILALASALGGTALLLGA